MPLLAVLSTKPTAEVHFVDVISGIVLLPDGMLNFRDRCPVLKVLPEFTVNKCYTCLITVCGLLIQHYD